MRINIITIACPLSDMVEASAAPKNEYFLISNIANNTLKNAPITVMMKGRARIVMGE